MNKSFLYSSNIATSTRYYIYNYNDNYFRLCRVNNLKKSGFELVNSFLKTSKDEVNRISLSRTKRNIRELALCNDFEYFVTLTLDKNICDRYDVDVAQTNLKYRLENYKRLNNDFRYLLITEKHKDGAFHFHGFFKNVVVNDLYKNKLGYLSSHYFDKWLGFNSFSKIRDYEKCCNYICKYISKDCVKNKHNQIYISSRGLKKATREEVSFIEDSLFKYHNEFCAIADISLDKSKKEDILSYIDIS